MAREAARGVWKSPDERTPLQDLEEEGGVDATMGGFICCRAMAPCSIRAFERSREDVLNIGHFICAIGAFITLLAYCGAFAWGDTLSYLSWAKHHGPEGDGYAGVWWICFADNPIVQESILTKPKHGHISTSFLIQGKDHLWACKSWAELDCDGNKDLCKECKRQSYGIVISGFVAVVTYFMFSYAITPGTYFLRWEDPERISMFYIYTDARLKGTDSNYTKFKAVGSGLFGGVNFLITATLYWYSCIVSARAAGFDMHAGFGLQLMYVATVLKILMGFVHLFLRVEASKRIMTVGAPFSMHN